MKKFRFNLETVLRVKRQLEEQRQRDLAVAQAHKDQALAQLGAFESSLRDLNQAQAQRRSAKSIDLAVEAWFHGSHSALSSNIIVARQVLATKEELLDAARTRAIEAARERKVLEKLEEKQRLEHQLKSNREEQGFMDEMAQHALSALAYASPSVPAD
jgi:flagellar FliJ protein